MLNVRGDIFPLQKQVNDPLTLIDSYPQERYLAIIILSAEYIKTKCILVLKASP